MKTSSKKWVNLLRMEQYAVSSSAFMGHGSLGEHTSSARRLEQANPFYSKLCQNYIWVWESVLFYKTVREASQLDRFLLSRHRVEFRFQHSISNHLYEANRLIPLFRSGSVSTRLHMFAARLYLRQSTLFHSAELILSPARTPALFYSELLDPELLVFSGSTARWTRMHTAASSGSFRGRALKSSRPLSSGMATLFRRRRTISSDSRLN